jgi:hypothetical protein
MTACERYLPTMDYQPVDRLRRDAGGCRRKDVEGIAFTIKLTNTTTNKRRTYQ